MPTHEDLPIHTFAKYPDAAGTLPGQTGSGAPSPRILSVLDEEAADAHEAYLQRRIALADLSPIRVFNIGESSLHANLSMVSLENTLARLRVIGPSVAIIVGDERLRFHAQRLINEDLPENIGMAFIPAPIRTDLGEGCIPEDWLVVSPDGMAIYNRGL